MTSCLRLNLVKPSATSLFPTIPITNTGLVFNYIGPVILDVTAALRSSWTLAVVDHFIGLAE